MFFACILAYGRVPCRTKHCALCSLRVSVLQCQCSMEIAAACTACLYTSAKVCSDWATCVSAPLQAASCSHALS